MGSSTPVAEIPQWELPHDMQIAYGDLLFAVARVIAIRRRIDPTESKINALAGALGYLNQEADAIFSKADTV